MNSSEKTVFIVFAILFSMLGTLGYCIIMEDYRIIFPILILVLFGIFFWVVKNNSENAESSKKKNNIISLPSVLFRRKKPFKIALYLPLILFLLPFIVMYYKPNGYLIIYAIFFLFIVLLSYLTTPKRLVFNQKEVRYHVYWKERWQNIDGYKATDGILEIRTKNNKKRIVKGLNKDDFKTIKRIFNDKFSSC